MTRELHKRLRLKDECIMREAAFNVSFEFTESSDSDVININKIKVMFKSNNQKQKRFRIQFLEINVSKKELTECSVCDMRKHSLTKC